MPTPAVSPADADLLETVKKAAVELKRAEIPFALCGGWAVYAHGGPQRPEHDADFALNEQDLPRALDVLTAAAFRRDRERRRRTGWPSCGATWVDLIFRLAGEAVTPDFFDRVDTLEVGSDSRPRCWPRPTSW